MSGLEHLLVILLTTVLIILYMHHKKSKKNYSDVVLLRDAALDISNHMMDIETTDEGFQYILEKCIEVIPGATLGSILMLDQEGYLSAHAHSGFSKHQIEHFRIPFKESFIYHATGGSFDKVIIINDLKALLQEKDTVETSKKGKYIQSQLTAPLMDGSKMIGVVCIDSLENRVFSDNHQMLLSYMMTHINSITKQQYLRESVIYHSRHDYLTGLYNRSYFDKRISNQLENIDQTLVLCSIDMDKLKHINDLHGHLIGDEIIRNFSKCLNNALKENEFAGRYGGDEFIVCFREEDTLIVTKRLEAIKKELYDGKILINEEWVYPHFSYGLVSFPEEGILQDVLLSKSDARMYEQKKMKIELHRV